MDTETSQAPSSASGESIAGGDFRHRLLQEHPWAGFVLPFVVYMLLGQLEPRPAVEKPAKGPPDAAVEQREDNAETPDAEQNEYQEANWLGLTMDHYPAVYAARILVTLLVMLFLVRPVYLQFPCRISPLSLLVGAVGIVVWVGVIQSELEERLLAPLGLGGFLGLGERVGYNPFTLGEEGRTLTMVLFFAVRFAGLVLIVPIIEEFFLRGFLCRYVADNNWTKLAVGAGSAGTLYLVAALYGALTHPVELFAAAIWFSMVTWLSTRTQNIWDCVAAHAVTNLLLGIYVVSTGSWALW